MDTSPRNAILGCLLGTAVGDALGLPFEGLSPRRRRRLFADPTSYRLLFGRGMTSDDTERTCLVADALMESAGNAEIFERALARGLRRWLLTLPPATGLATLRATIKLCLGIDPKHSGVFSAGHGPAMRSALIGVCQGTDVDHLRQLVQIATRITHTDPKAADAAFAVAMAAHMSRCGQSDPSEFYEILRQTLGEQSGFCRAMGGVVESVIAGTSTPEFAERAGFRGGPSGYCLQSVPVALHAWLRHPADFRAAVLDAVECGGDTDTMAAITGAIVGARVGLGGIPRAWIDGILDWPRSQKWLMAQGEQLSVTVESGIGRKRTGLPFVPLLLRNGVFAVIVIAHGLRRLLPPYAVSRYRKLTG